MGQTTAIPYVHHTWSPWWGCTKVSPGCAHCYAERDSTRWGHACFGTAAPRRFLSARHWNEPSRSERLAKAEGVQHRVLVSMCDPFEDRPDLVVPRDRFLRVIEQTPHLDWLLLTKRPENMVRLTEHFWYSPRHAWPSNAWACVTCEDQATADRRIPILQQIPARVRVLSLEPLLEEIHLRSGVYGMAPSGHLLGTSLTGIHWVIVGGESGPHARPCNVAWIRSIVAQCQSAGVPVFVKQLGSNPICNHSSTSNDSECFPFTVRDPKGADSAEWPADLRVQQFPFSVVPASPPASEVPS